MATTTRKSTDFLPALTGLVVGGCVLFALMFGIVVLVNQHYAGEKAGVEATAR